MSNPSPSKLSGWKEIAGYLNTSVRTAQRWEQELGLPVHHAGSSKGYSVIADVEELESWLAGTEGSRRPTNDQHGQATSTDSTIPSRRSPRKWLAIAALGVVAAGSVIAVFSYRATHPPKVGSITFSGRQMLAWSNGKFVWSYDFGQPTRVLPPENLRRRVCILSSKGDHDGEVIVAAPLLQLEAGELSTDAIYCFSSTGKLLWRHVFTDRVHFGGEECGPRWDISDLTVSGDSKTWSAWCTVCSYPTSVSMVVKIDPSGNTTRYFVNYGHLGQLSEWHAGDGSYLLAGGINNESNEGALAVLDEIRPSGHSPQAEALSECDSCPTGLPYRYFVFPRSELARATSYPYNGVLAILVTNAQIQVITTEGTDIAGGVWALYGISEALVPQSAYFSDRYRFLHENLSSEGKIKHPLDACPERLKPIAVREWSPQEGWENILLPPVESRPLNSALRR
jgi:hypothetical protein